MSDATRMLTGAVDLGQLPETIGYTLRRAQISVFQDFHNGMAALELRPAQFSVLHVLRHNPGVRPSQVAEALAIKRTNFVPLLDELEGRGLVERRRDPEDGRAFSLHLSAEGEALLRRAERLVRTHERRVAARLEPGGAAQLLRLLRQLTTTY